MIHPVVGVKKIIVVAQEWPCWLPVALAWALPVDSVFSQVHLHGVFRPLVDTETVFRSLEEWSSLTCLPPAWNGCTILASG